MNTPAFRKQLPIFVVALAGTLCAHAAQALDVSVSVVTVSDAETGDTKLLLGRKLLVRCRYEYTGPIASVPAWQIQLLSDGQTIGTYPAEGPPLGLPSYNPQTKSFGTTTKSLWVDGFVTPKTVGEHKARCVLDPAGKLKSAGDNPTNNAQDRSFVVDVVPRLSIPKTPGPSAANPSGPVVPPSKGGFAPGGGAASAQGSAPVLTDPALVLDLKAQVLANCGPGQDVVAITGAVKNVGSGFAVIPPGKPVVTIDVAAGVYGTSITTANIAPGQSAPVSANLKAKAQPSSLAAAVLKLNASVNQTIKQSSYGGNQTLTVVFPSNFCKSPATTTGSRPVVAPTGRSVAK